ncbi:MAG: superfamily and helicase, partial [Phenylobacterium sp.]|nr:superfamily and helicase [Phenylobacterium sp.]
QPDARALTQALASREASGWRPSPDKLSRLPDPAPSPRALAAFGLRAVGGLAAPVEHLEALDDLLRAGVRQGGGVLLSDQARDALGWSEAEAQAILRGLGFAAIRRPGESTAWRRRFEREFAVEHRPIVPHSPFAALAALHGQPEPVRRPRRRKRRA